MFSVYFLQAVQVGIVIAPLSLYSAKDMLVDFLAFAIQCFVGFIALGILGYGLGILAALCLSPSFLPAGIPSR